jgi:uncharacterized lipoprotein NlpE involved in copper resistance
MFKSIISVAVVSLLLMSCNSEKESHSEDHHQSGLMSEDHNSHENNDKVEMSNMEMGNNTNVSKNSILTPIIDTYIRLKNSLVQDDGNSAAKAGKMLFDSFKKLNKSKIEESKLKEYNEIVEDALEHAEHIGENADNIDHQREHFEILSTDIVDLIKLLGTDRTLFVDKCPMYNDGKGAKWISETKDIKNPFLGGEMPKCGSIISTIK